MLIIKKSWFIAFSSFLVACSGGGSSSGGSTQPPVPAGIASLQPLDGAENVPVDSKITIQFSRAMDPQSINDNTFHVLLGGQTIIGKVSASASEATFTPTASLEYYSRYTVKLDSTVRSKQGNPQANEVIWSFLTQQKPPQINKLTPLNNATLVPPDTQVSIFFDQPIDASTISPATFFIEGPGGIVNATLSMQERAILLTPSQLLQEQVDYTVTLKAGVRNQVGGVLANDFVWKFHTKETVPPSVLMTNPGSGQANVDVQSVITVQFSEPLNPATLDSSSFIISDIYGNEIPGQMLLSAANDFLTFTPNIEYIPESTHTITVTTDVQDVSGNAFAQDFVSNFSTIPFVSPTCAPVNLNLTVGQDYTGEFVVSSNSQKDVFAVWIEQAFCGPMAPPCYLPNMRKYDFTPSIWIPSTPQSISMFASLNPILETKIAINSAHQGFAAFVIEGIDVNGQAVDFLRAEKYLPSLNTFDVANFVELATEKTIVSPQLVIDEAGNAMALWVAKNILWSRYYSAELGIWLAESSVSNPLVPAGIAPQTPSIAMHAEGNVFAVWSQNLTANLGGDGKSSIWGSYYDLLNNKWSQPLLIDNDSTDVAITPKVVALDADHALAAWIQTISTQVGGDGVQSVFASELNVVNNNLLVGNIIPLELDGSGNAGELQLAATAQGKAAAVWSQFVSLANGGDGQRSIYAQIWDQQWNPGGPTLIETDVTAGNVASQPSVSAARSGHFYVTWGQIQGVAGRIMRNIYDSVSDSWVGEKNVSAAGMSSSISPKSSAQILGTGISIYLNRDNPQAKQTLTAVHCD